MKNIFYLGLMIFLHFIVFVPPALATGNPANGTNPAGSDALKQQQQDSLLQSQVQFLEQQTLQQHPPKDDSMQPAPYIYAPPAIAPEQTISKLPSMAQANEQSFSAIKRCESQRLNGLLKSHQDSARCASAEISLAFKRASYPYMDLIKQLTAKYVQVAQEIDRNKINEDNANAQIAEFINYINTEERNRSLKIN